MDEHPDTDATVATTKARRAAEKRWANKDVHRISLNDLSPEMRGAVRALIAAHRHATTTALPPGRGQE